MAFLPISSDTFLSIISLSILRIRRSRHKAAIILSTNKHFQFPHRGQLMPQPLPQLHQGRFILIGKQNLFR